MTPPPLQATRFDRLLRRLGDQLLGGFRGSWRRRSLLVLSLLLGFYAGGNVTSYVLPLFPGGRPAIVLTLVLALELLVRLRSRMVRGVPSLGWRIADNLRIGLVYAIVLEAYKLGT